MAPVDGLPSVQERPKASLRLQRLHAGLQKRTSALQAGPLPEAQVRALFQQLVSAVDYSYRLGVISRDIKLGNILLASR